MAQGTDGERAGGVIQIKPEAQACGRRVDAFDGEPGFAFAWAPGQLPDVNRYRLS